MKTFSAKRGSEEFIDTSCNICGSDRYRVRLTSEDFRFVECTSCGLVYQNPMPVFNDLKKRYTQGYFEYELENDKNFFNLMKLGLEDIGFDRITANGFDSGYFLDIGCATGMLCDFMQKKGWRAKGVDICEESARYGREKRGVDIFTGTLFDAHFRDEEFSVIHFSHLIEHVPDPTAMMTEVRRILSNKGIAVITTPNIKGFQAGLFREKWRSAIADHLNLFSKATLTRLLVKTGFSIKKTVTWGGLAAGTAPKPIKWMMDKSAKKFGFGDVMLFLVEKNLNYKPAK